jgi:hypothetical protein
VKLVRIVERSPGMSARVAVLGWAFLLGSCANGLGDQVREHTYPTGFHYVTHGELRSAMERLAGDARALDALLVQTPAEPTADLRPLVLSILHDMREAAGELEPKGVRTNHPMLERHIPQLIQEIEAAERAARAERPNYHYAASVAGACVHCHGHEASPRVTERR